MIGFLLHYFDLSCHNASKNGASFLLAIGVVLLISNNLLPQMPIIEVNAVAEKISVNSASNSDEVIKTTNDIYRITSIPNHNPLRKILDKLRGKRISIRQDGLCLFRAALVETKKNKVYAKMEKNEVMKVIIEEYGELLKTCIEEQWSIFHPSFMDKYVNGITVIQEFAFDNLDTMYTGEDWAALFCQDTRLGIGFSSSLIDELQLFAEGITNLFIARLKLTSIIRTQNGLHFDVRITK